MLAVGELSARHPWKIIAGTAAVALLSLTGPFQLRFSHDPMTWFAEDDPLRRATELIAQELLLFESSGADDLENFVDTRFSKGRFTIAAALVANIVIAPALLVLITRKKRVAVRRPLPTRSGWIGEADGQPGPSRASS